MCGIAGYLSCPAKNDRVGTNNQMASLRKALAHRGPDDSGLWRSPSGAAHLMHTRLAILDLSQSGNQPMHTRDGRFTITFNGEIYNYKELRQELAAAEASFSSESDTEVLLHLYQRHGPGMVERLRGMFAFCIWDELEQCAFLARDPMGIKPLYYSLATDGSLVFASELKALRRSGLVSDQLNGGALVAYFETGSVPEPWTLLQNVFQMEAGCWMLWREGRLKQHAYWQLQFGGDEIEGEEAVHSIRTALLDSVRHHFVSDVPVGIFLSGGIDSTALLALSQAAGFSGIKTFSIGVDDQALDESGVARETARHFGSEHHEMQLSGSTAEQSFAEFLHCGDQPSIDGFNTYTVSRFARHCGMKVVLSGLGGGEMFGGYPSFSAVPKLARFSRMAGYAPPVAGLLGDLLERFGKTARVRRLGTMFGRPPGIQSAYRAFRSTFSLESARTLTQRYVTELPEEAPDYDPGMRNSPGNDLDQVSKLEISRYMRNQLLKDSDMMSMAHGLELRVPYVDRVLFETVARVPAAQRLRPGKEMLLDAVPEVPANIAQARKRGFVFPFEMWLQASWGNEFENATRKIPDANPTWYQRWSVFVLERWLENK